MRVKNFLILSILIVFLTVSCAGPNKVGWTKPGFRQDQFEKDREDCVQAIQDGLEQKLTVEKCLAKKGYESEHQPASDKEKSKTAEMAKNVGAVLLVVVFVVVGVAALAALILAGH